MKWIKFTKHFRNGEHSDYAFVEDEELNTEDQQEELMENWGENSDGGHAYGYRVEMEILKDEELPPQEWLEKAVKRNRDAIGYLKAKINETKKELKVFENLIK